MGRFNIEWRVAQDDDVHVRAVQRVQPGQFIDPRANQVRTDGVVIAETAARKQLPKSKVAEFVFGSASHVPGRQPEDCLFRTKGGEQVVHAWKHLAPLFDDRGRKELQVAFREPCVVRQDRITAVAEPFEHLEEDGPVGPAVEEDALGRLFDAELAMEGEFHGGASRPERPDHGHIDVEQEDARHRPSVPGQLAPRRKSSHDSPVSIELRAPGARALVEPTAGGRLHQLLIDIDGVETPLLWSPDDFAQYERTPVEGGCYPMAPWPNRIRNGGLAWGGKQQQVDNGREHAIHGLVCDRPWVVVARVGRVVELACEFDQRWPWPGRAWQRFELGPNFLAMKMEVRAAREAFPAGCGWHPWFRRALAGEDSGSVRLTVPADARYEMVGQVPRGPTVSPAGEFLLDGSPLAGRRLDDCYTALRRPVVTIEWQRLRLTMSIECAFPHVQVYTPPEAFCVEPQTCAPDAFNLPDVKAGAAVAAPGRPLSLSCRWTWEAQP